MIGLAYQKHPFSGPALSQLDNWLLGVAVTLILLGLIMVCSSAIMVSTSQYHQPFFYLIRQLLFLSIGLVVAKVILHIDSSIWQRYSVPALFTCLFLLLIVLIPGIGKVVNGSRRWLAFGPIGIQVSEIAKLTMVVYMASYLVRQKDKVTSQLSGFINPMIVLGIVSLLLLREPDFGATVVISFTVMSMLFIAGVKFRYYTLFLIVVAFALTMIALSSPYRVARLTAFLDPWADQFNTGYQLTQALIAFGRGGIWGVGLGDSVQKLFYLPESHTDFLFAVLAEELGFAGVMLVVILYCILIMRGIKIANNAYRQQRLFAAYVAYGLTFWLALQSFINMGVNAGLLPTKGLTLPLLSYGGASLIINCIMIACLLRIDYENKVSAAMQ
ncbi:putative lipid II flippase FtsW [Legionella sp. W05-934-2]|jgi:cell division protein FtsW|uniref:putative lipid II flippase FtsW n=1 Tax=Legionella sp. W05-934-2 TaxID=1198649 RepID=UPI003462A411